VGTQRRKTPRLNEAVEEAIRYHTQEMGLQNAARVKRAVDAWCDGLGDIGSPPLPDDTPRKPDIRTVRERFRQLSPPDDSGTWALAEHNPKHPEAEPSPAEVAAVMPVLAEVAHRTEGRVAQLTRRQAKLICRVRAAAPTLAPWFVYRVALAYQRREAEEKPTEDLDLMLAYEPWHSPTRYRLFEKWVREHRPQWVGGYTTLVPREGELEVSVPLIDGMWLAVEALVERATDAAVNIVSQEVRAGLIPPDEAQAQVMAWLKEGIDHTILANIHADNVEGAEDSAAGEGADGSAQV
jgi:hypothetical protein